MFFRKWREEKSAFPEEKIAFLTISKQETVEDGTSLFWYTKPDVYLITCLINEYWEMWECAALPGTPYYVSFGAYEKELGGNELEYVVKEEKLQGYLVKVVPMGDNDGLGFSIDESLFSEKELITRIRSILDRYHLELKVTWNCEQ